MRLQQLHQIQTIDQRFRSRHPWLTWTTSLTILMGSAGLSSILFSQPVHAAAPVTPPTTVAPGPTTTTKPTSMAITPSLSTSTTATVTSAPTSLAASAATPPTKPTTVMATTTTAAVSNSTMPNSAGQMTTMMPASGEGPNSEAVASQVTRPVSAAQPAAVPATSATSSVPTQAITALPDTTVVAFGDSQLQHTVQTNLGLTGAITLGAIRKYAGPNFAIGTDNIPLQITGTLAGMQYLQALPQTTLISLVTQFNAPNIDLTPLVPDRFSEIAIMNHDLGTTNLSPLTQINPKAINEVQLVGTSHPTGNADYMTNSNGMTNAQLAQLAPWLTAIDNTGNANSFNFNDNSLTDFSPLKGFAKMTYVVAIGQRTNLNGMPVNFVVGQPGTFQATPLLGLQGEDLTAKFQNTVNGSPTNATPGKPLVETNLKYLNNGTFQIATAYPAVADANWFEYGFHGLARYAGNRADFINARYPNGTIFRYDTVIYQPANWQATPQVYVRYLNSQTGRGIQLPTLMTGKTIGDAYNLSPLTTVSPAYAFAAQDSSPLQGTFTQDPQFLTLQFTPRQTGTVTVNYVDTAAHVLAPATTLSGYVGDAYHAQPVSIPGYTVINPLSAGLITLNPSSITLTYQANQLTRTIMYVDDTLQHTLQTDTLTAPYQTVSSKNPATVLNNYLVQGYRLISTDVPTVTQLFATPAATATYTVHLAHQLITLRPTTTPLPTGIQLKRQVTETIRYQTLAGKVLAPSNQQSLTFTRTAQWDPVTQQATYTPWTSTQVPRFAAMVSPRIAGYQPTPATTAAVDTITADTPDITTVVYYQPRSAVVTPYITTTPLKRPIRPLQPTATRPTNLTTVTTANTSGPQTAQSTATAPTLPTDWLRAAEKTSPNAIAKVSPAKTRPGSHALPQTSEAPTKMSLLGLLLVALTTLVSWGKRRMQS